MILKINSSLETVYIWVIVLLGYKGSRATKVFENRKIQFLFKDWLKIHTLYVVLPCTSSLLRVDCGKCQENCTLVNCPRLTFDTLVIFCPTTTFIVINCKCERSVFQHFRIFVPKRRRKKKSKLKKGTSRFDALYKELKWLISFLPLFRTILV